MTKSTGFIADRIIRFLAALIVKSTLMKSVARPHATVSDMEAEARLILSGAFLGYLPEHYAQQFVDAGRMRAIQPDRLRVTVTFQASLDDSKQADPITKLFLDMLIRDFGVNPD